MKMRIKKEVLWVVISLFLVASALFVLAADPVLDPIPSYFNLTQGVLFTFDVNATDADNDTLNFSSNAADTDFSSFQISPGTGLINFTPTNDDVTETGTVTGYHSIAIIVQDENGDGDVSFIDFYVYNTNDAPNITTYIPTDLTPNINENLSQNFSLSYTATDVDVPLGLDNLSSIWMMDDVIVDQNASNYAYIADYCSAGVHTIIVNVTDTFFEMDYVMWNLTVDNINRPPILYNPFSNISWDEDTNLTNYLNLLSFFNESDYLECTGTNKDTLTFSAHGNTKIDIVINQTDFNVSFLLPSDWYGNETVRIRAYDGFTYVYSNYFVLSVNNTNDPPIIYPIPNQTTYEYTTFTYQINYTDIDSTNLVFEANNSIVGNISSTGLINVSITEGDEGNYSILINVTDGDGGNDSEIMNLFVYNNNPPQIVPIANQSALENQPFIMYVTATDLENESINFTSDYSSFIITKINDTTTQFSFTPLETHVGNTTVTVAAHDIHGATSTDTFLLTVIDVNSAPVLSPIGNQLAKINKLYSEYVTAYDADEDELTFADNTSLFNINTLNPYTGLAQISFTPTLAQVGNYSINITVNDSVLDDWELVNFLITENRAPVINDIGTQNLVTGETMALLVNASDPDGDNLTFSLNDSRVNVTYINITTSRLGFIPNSSHVGLIDITVTVSDGDGGSDSTNFTINVSWSNHPPIFSPLPSNQLFINGSASGFRVSGWDQDGDSLTFDTNISWLNRNVISTTSVYFNTTPVTLGNFSCFINVTDGNNTNSTIINITVIAFNNPPVITSVTPSNSTRPSVYENSTLFFNQTSYDPENANLIYSWQIANRNTTRIASCENHWNLYGTEIGCTNNTATTCIYLTNACVPSRSNLNFTVQSTDSNWTYNPNWTAAGDYVVKLIVSDPQGKSDNVTWDLRVLDTNRAPIFGLKSYEGDDFDAGTFLLTQKTRSGGIALRNTTQYISPGEYTSPALPFNTARLEFNQINWSAVVPTSPTGILRVRFQTRSKGASGDWSNWSSQYTAAPAAITSTGNRYLQYKASLTSGDLSLTPVIYKVSTSYTMADSTIDTSTRYLNWFDLDNFFYDPDSDNTLTFNYSFISREGDLEVEIENDTNQVSLFTLISGVSVVSFSATDGNNITYSNNITITAEEAVGTTSTSGGGGGGAKRTITIKEPDIRNSTKNDTKLVALQIISPGAVTIYENETFVVPIEILNNYNQTLNGVQLTATSDNNNSEFYFDTDFFAEIPHGVKKSTLLTIKNFRSSGSYEIIVKAESKNPAFEDSVKLFVNSLELGKEDRDQVNTKITFTQDLLSENPECLELNELLESAKERLNAGDYSRARELLDTVINNCRFLISKKDPIDDGSRDLTIMERLSEQFARNRTMYYLIIIMVIVFGGVLAYWSNKKIFSRKK